MRNTKTVQNLTSMFLFWKKPKSRIVSAVIKGISPIKVEVSDIRPTQAQLEQLDLASVASGHTRWVVKSIERSGIGKFDLLITFWNGVKITSFDPLYIIEKEVSNA
jgi:hypothetical protein